MKFVCGRCEQLTTGKAYQVVSRESGILYLNLIVCRTCYADAQALGLDAHEIDLRNVYPSLRTHLGERK